MKVTILSLLFAFSLCFTAFSQKGNTIKTPFVIVNSEQMTISKDSTITTMTGNVEIEGDNFHFRKASKIVYNKKENILQVYGAEIVNAGSLTVLKGDDGKDYIRYKLK